MSFSRYSIEKKQISNDRGVTWEDVTPAETRYGELIAVTRTLAECEDIDCDLEKDEYYVADGILPDNICANVIDTIPYGIALSVTFTDGAVCCSTWGQAGAYITKLSGQRKPLSIGKPICGNGYCPTFAYSANVDTYGFEIELGYYPNTCVGAVSTCLRIEQFMPWAEGKSTWKMIYKQHYTREHCSDEWFADGAEELEGIGERWIKESEDFNNEYWRHQIASSFDESGNVTTWTDAELGTRQMSTYTLPQYLDILDYVKNDGVAWVSLTNTSIPSPFIMDISLDGDLAASGYTYATAYRWFSTYNWGGYTAAYYNDDNPGYFINHMNNTGENTEKLLKLTNTFQKIIYRGGDHRRLFANVGLNDDYGTVESEPSEFAYGMRHGKMYDPTSEETIAFPYRIRENRGQQDDYYNSSEIGYILRDGTKLVIRTLNYSTKYVGTYSNGTNYKIYCESSISTTLSSRDTKPDGYDYSLLLTADIGNCVTSIGDNAFYNCTSLTSCTIGSGVTSIGASAFGSCRRLTSIDIPSGVTSIGSSAFDNCSGLTSVTINATTPPTLGSSAFNNTNNCPIYVPAGSVDTYKAASGWRNYASRIQAITN